MSMPSEQPTQISAEAFADLCRSIDVRPLSYRFAKRTFDLVFSLIIAIMAFVPCLLLSVAVVADTKGTPIYSQMRVGKGGRPFRIYKFRTMVADADDVEKYLSPEQLVEWHREHKVGADPRITKFGRTLRKTSLDELPQFLNVLAGQLSIVGPRAITSEELPHYGLDAPELLSVPQGITGAWQVGPRNDATFENGERQRIELAYVRNASFKEDGRILLATFSTMFGKDRSGI